MSTSSGVTTLFCMFSAIVFILIIFLASAFRIVREDKRLSVYRLGRYIGDKGPGVVFLLPLIDRGVLIPVGSMGIPVVTDPQSPSSGNIAETRTTVFAAGKVFYNGKEWDAMSQSPIPAGQKVRVVRTILEVEKE